MGSSSVKSAAQLVSEAKQRVENLTPEQVAAELERGAVLIDIRELEEQQQNGVIPNASMRHVACWSSMPIQAVPIIARSSIQSAA